jgi:hypothetical protein
MHADLREWLRRVASEPAFRPWRFELGFGSGGDARDPASVSEPVDLDVDDSYTTVAGLPRSLGAVLDQDTVNLAAQTRGFKAGRKTGQTLGNYQEVRARHFQATVRRYIDEGRTRHPNPSTEQQRES